MISSNVARKFIVSLTDFEFPSIIRGGLEKEKINVDMNNFEESYFFYYNTLGYQKK